MKFIIKDWAGNILNHKGRFEMSCFAVAKEFPSFEDAWDHILGDMTDRLNLTEEDYGEFYVEEKGGAQLNALIKDLGPFPHAGINLADRKKQTTRLNKAECRECGYTVRVTAKWLETLGAPLCPCNGEHMEVKP